jgi:hypothetical protein
MFNLFKSNRCVDGGKEHKFEPRYDEKIQPQTVKINGESISPNDVIKIVDSYAIKDKKYVKDVCVWCGKEIKR